ncbi:hypothetical protein M422DRAFT_249073 [Sphaerobolus stellatus SS14]|nr:hypothetical protein M422DRAFT_249073 [Sphaerobolus stellatus SS14]
MNEVYQMSSLPKHLFNLSNGRSEDGRTKERAFVIGPHILPFILSNFLFVAATAGLATQPLDAFIFERLIDHRNSLRWT